MGHLLQPKLSQSRRWRDVIAQLEAGANAELIAGASARAAETALKHAANDAQFHEAVSLLIKLPLSARGPGFVDEMADLGIEISGQPDLFEFSAAVMAALDTKAAQARKRTDLGEMAQLALLESLSAAIESQLPSLFEPGPDEVRQALGRLATGDRFAGLARSFFARLMYRCLDYYLARELASHVGPGERFADDSARRAFDEALALHCREAAAIVEMYSAGWLGKNVYQGDGPTSEKIRGYARYAFTKLRAELESRRDAA